MTISEAVPTSNRVVHRVLTDGEYIVNHSLITGEDGPTAVRFDLWRLANGAVAEHWADEEQWASETASGHTQIDGQQAIDHSEDAEATRRIATSAVQTILVEGDTSALGQHLAGVASRACGASRILAAGRRRCRHKSRQAAAAAFAAPRWPVSTLGARWRWCPWCSWPVG